MGRRSFGIFGGGEGIFYFNKCGKRGHCFFVCIKKMILGGVVALYGHKFSLELG